MKRLFLCLSLVTALPLFAQQAPKPGDVVVASVNGEAITRAKLDQLWNRLSEKTRAQYDKTGGGKAGFLENYIRKYLVIQQARKTGFEKESHVQAEIEAAKESALFDLYVRDVISTEVVKEEDIRAFYEQNKADFTKPDRVRMRHILVSTSERSEAQAIEKITPVMQELFAARGDVMASGGGAQQFENFFAEAAKKYSEDITGPQGGELGWLDRDMLEAKIAEAAFQMKPGTMSGILKSPAGVHLIFVQEQQPAHSQSYEEARQGIREFLVSSNAQKVVDALQKTTTALRSSGKVTVFPENIR